MSRAIVYCLLSVVFLSGCLSRTYTVVRDRVDQDVAGNQGFIGGSAPSDYQQAPKKFTTRRTRVVEVEFGKPLESEKPVNASDAGVAQAAQISAQEGSLEVTDDLGGESAPAISEAIESKEAVEIPQTYVVQKNDTLQKISQHFYGTTKKWTKIFEANKEKLKTPDRIRPGQVIKLPQE